MPNSFEFNEIEKKLRLINESTQKIKIQQAELFLNPPVLKVTVISNCVLNQETILKIENVISSFMPQNFKKVEVNAKKIKADTSLVHSLLYNKISTSYLYLTVEKDDIVVDELLNYFKVYIKLQPSQQTIYNSNKIGVKLTEFLSGEFCEDFVIELLTKTESAIKNYDVEADESDFFAAPYRTITVKDVQGYISYDNTDTAIYIADAISMRQELYVCGVITGIRELKTKKEKPMFLIDFTDKTSRLTGKFFPSEKKVQATRLLKEGDAIIVKGEMGEYNGRPDFTIKNMGFCTFPQDFVPERKAGKPIPGIYKKVFPCEIEDTVQLNMFAQDNYVPGCLIGKTFVVFDIETTGLEADSEKITEIGAVKIIDGKIVDGFTVLINPQKPIPPEIVQLTGITDEMVADCPVFGDIIGDFMKYTNGATLIAHNASFDVNFVKKAAEKEGYYLENEYLDTMEIARKNVLGLKNYKLNTICEHFGITFLHHRAMSDAHATAKMFLEIIKLKKCLPN